MSTSKVEINSGDAQPSQKEQVDALKKEGVNVETMQDNDGNRVEVSTPDIETKILKTRDLSGCLKNSRLHRSCLRHIQN